MRRKSRREYGIAVGGRRTKKGRKEERMVEAEREGCRGGYRDARKGIDRLDI